MFIGLCGVDNMEKKLKVWGHLELEIMSILREEVAMTTLQIIRKFQEEYLNPPNPDKIRRTLRKLYVKDKLDRVRLSSLANIERPNNKHISHYLFYFIPEKPPEWLKDYYEQQEKQEINDMFKNRQ